MWHWYSRKGTSVPFDDDSTSCLQSTSFLSKWFPVQSVSAGRPWWCYIDGHSSIRAQLCRFRCSAKTAKLSSDGRGSPVSPSQIYKPKALSGANQHWTRVHPLMGLPWHQNKNREWTRLHTAVPEWLSGLIHRISLHVLLSRPQVDTRRDSCLEYWVCLALSGVHRLYHLRLPWHMPTKGPWAHDEATCCVCCGTVSFQLARTATYATCWVVVGLKLQGWSDLNQTECWWFRSAHKTHIFKSLNAEDFKLPDEIPRPYFMMIY